MCTTASRDFSAAYVKSICVFDLSLVETKNEYTIQLVNILTPLVYDGFESIYEEVKKIIKKCIQIKN